MTKWMTAMALAALLLVAGCSGVLLSARYSRQLDETAAWSAECARRARTGGLDANQMAEALTGNAEAWRLFQDARDGRAQTPEED